MTLVAATMGARSSSGCLKKQNGESANHEPKTRTRLKHHYDRPLLAEIIPSRWDDEPIIRAQSALSGLAGTEGFSLEFVASSGRLRFYVRALSHAVLERVRGHLTAAYPQADFTEVPVSGHADLDPA